MTTCVYETDVLFSESTLIYLLEAGPEVKQSALSKMISKVKELLEKLKRFIQETVFRKRVKAVEDAVKKNPELGEKKVKVVDIDKKLKVEEEFVKDLKNAKTPADVEKAKAKRKKALKIAAVAAAAITIAAGLLHIKNTKTRTKNLCDAYMQVIGNAEESIAKSRYHVVKRFEEIDNIPTPGKPISRLYQPFEDGAAGPDVKTQKMTNLKRDAASELGKKFGAHRVFVNNKTVSFSLDSENITKIAKSKKRSNEYIKTAHSILTSIAESENTVLKDMDAISKRYIDALHNVLDNE